VRSEHGTAVFTCTVLHAAADVSMQLCVLTFLLRPFFPDLGDLPLLRATMVAAREDVDMA
jgi:hypothetical protein